MEAEDPKMVNGAGVLDETNRLVLPRKKWTRHAPLNKPREEVWSPLGPFEHKRTCHRCDLLISVTSMTALPGTMAADQLVWRLALLEGWRVDLLISAGLRFTCPRCALKAV